MLTTTHDLMTTPYQAPVGALAVTASTAGEADRLRTFAAFQEDPDWELHLEHQDRPGTAVLYLTYLPRPEAMVDETRANHQARLALEEAARSAEASRGTRPKRRRPTYTIRPRFARGDRVTMTADPGIYCVLQVRWTLPDVMGPYIEYGIIAEPPDGYGMRWHFEADLRLAAA